ncbi:hypothetical protein RHGRI_023896 [Rhododendron griersonianum]|uniref:Alpha-L-arabinofuranosidase 1 catalytic domain-containing protein n=1 Tax=Rhododendron griersonianum TaxID=479676 RepID=A0AAV6JCH8_9ERIC|nr:hypothetical protein RHGRI_023896 [Rhododendron griersonianum]
MGHLEPFDLRYVAVGNEDYGKKNYCGNYLKFYDAIRHAYPDIKLSPIVMALLDNWIILPISMIIIDANMVFCLAHKFNHASHSGPKDFVSEYAVNMSLLAALAVTVSRYIRFLNLNLGSDLHDGSKEYVATLISQRSF